MTTARSLDPITIEVVRNKLEGIANQMQLTLTRAAFSPIVKESGDCSAALFTVRGETLAQPAAIPIHLATMIPALATLLDEIPLAAMSPGDMYILNDPYCGGTHLPDIMIFAPVFFEGVPIAFSGATVHHHDVGGLTPGSIPTNAVEIYQEGLRIPLLKLADKGVLNETLFKMMELNIRLPHVFFGDLHAQIACVNLGIERIKGLCQTYEPALLTEIFDELLDRSEHLTREALRQLPNGTFRYHEYLDNDGVDFDTPIRIEVAVTIADGGIHFDLTGSGDQVRGPFNCVPSGARAAAFCAIRSLTGTRIPSNGGCFRPVSLFLPEGSIVNPRAPAPVNARTMTIKAMAICMIGALGEALPNTVPAPPGGLTLMMAFGGRKRDGSNFILAELLASGTGGSSGKDGVDCLHTDVNNGTNTPVEAMALDTPLWPLRFGLAQDSAGPGRHRGGFGVVREYLVIGDEVRLSYRGERHVHVTKGAFGGHSGKPARAVITRADGTRELLRSKAEIVLRKGDRLLCETPGGAGYGDPLQRDRTAVEDDLRNGKISLEAAMRDYGYQADAPAESELLPPSAIPESAHVTS